MEELLNQNSKNSSQPPSTDQKANRSLLAKVENRPYHPGARRKLLPASAVTSQEVCSIKVCPYCHAAMHATDKFLARQQIELPEIKPLVHQIDRVTSKCPCCHLQIRPELKENEQFLIGLKTGRLY
ncbi:Transposase [Neochlamydia sp. S13]|nr:Transposase [Neochlamydia sp. S13]